MMNTPIGTLSGRKREKKMYGSDAGRSSRNQLHAYARRALFLSITTSPKSFNMPGHNPALLRTITGVKLAHDVAK